MHNKQGVDTFFLITVLILTLGGFFMFVSASLGLHAREGVKFSSVVINQLGGLVLGLVALGITSRISPATYKKYALHIFIGGIIATLMVFLPVIGMSHGGARRWIYIGPITFQSSELLKIGAVIYMSAWYSTMKAKVSSVKFGLAPFLAVTGISGFVLLLQPDTDTFIVTAVTAGAIYFVSGASWKHLFVSFLAGVVVLAGVVAFRPYVLERVKTFFEPHNDTQGSGYQVNQSLIAIGSGGFTGKGFGQSAQKFKFLPEPIGDSIFAVAAEEFGFLGGSAIIIAFLLFLSRGLYIARRSKDMFGGLVVLGIVIMTLIQSYMNIAAMVGVFPLMGIPLLFVSHGGSALLMLLIEMGIVLSVSRTMSASQGSR
ncbi:MAG: FtsW/RodA/SpoVE family cell cycle protein [Candidatus Yonathbacteria bacterium]|nr:FtsW/RodA/SpoVE family cell cycle protein [Candidatus Yonathbacteria bacterium]